MEISENGDIKAWCIILLGTIPTALGRPQEVGLDDLPTLLGSQEDTEMLEGVVHRDFAAGIPVVDHNYTGDPAKKMKEQYVNSY